MRIRLLALLASTVAGAGCLGSPEPLDVEDAENAFVDEEAIIRDQLEAADATGPLRFKRACEPGERIHIAAVGDLLLHPTLQRQAYAEGWSSLWGGVTRWLDDAQVTYGNHEGTAARGVSVDWKLVTDPGRVYDGYVYTGFPKFNYHDSLERALRDASFDVVSTANNHALDRGPIGIDRTLLPRRSGKRFHLASPSSQTIPGSRRVEGALSGITKNCLHHFLIRRLMHVVGACLVPCMDDDSRRPAPRKRKKDAESVSLVGWHRIHRRPRGLPGCLWGQC